MKHLVVFLLLFSIGHSAIASDPDCDPGPAKLQKFFNGQSDWIEVENAKSWVVEENKTVELFISFADYMDSKVLMNGKMPGQLLGVCIISSNQMVLEVKKGRRELEIKFRRLAPELFESKFRVPIFGEEVYYYRPANSPKLID